MRHETYQDGQLVQTQFTGDLANEQAELVARANREATARIEEVYPPYKQTNTLLGIYGEPAKAEMALFINAVRTRCHAIEAEIEACTTLEQLADVNIAYD